MKWIGFVVVLGVVVAFGVTTYLVTRPPEKTLEVSERAWVSAYEDWSGTKLRQLDEAVVRMEFGALERNAGLVEPLRSCTASLTELGAAPTLLEDVGELAFAACGRAEHAARLNDRFDISSLASIKLHLRAAEERLRVARRTLRLTLADDAPV